MVSRYWADQVARRVIETRSNKKNYTIAAGVTPSGTVHIGNFREIITCDLVKRALESQGKKVRFIYSWDDFDRFRKIPGNLPKKELLKRYIGFPTADVPDPFGKCHKNYAEHLEKELEESLVPLKMDIKFIYQNKMFKKNVYANNIKIALEKRATIKKILDKYRKEPHPEPYWPVFIFCRKCGSDFTKVLDWDGKYTLTYSCITCRKEHKTNFKTDKPGIVSLPWRIDWPMRWAYESVDFEPGGKEHSTHGGSRTTAVEVVREIYDNKPPVYQMYDFVIIKGAGGKMSSSLGNVLSIGDVLRVYSPEVLRYIFAGTKPVKEFSFDLDEDVLKIVEDFYQCERIYYGLEKASPRDKAHWSRVYEMSVIQKPSKNIPIQPSFRKCLELINIYRTPKKALASIKKLEKVSGKRNLERYENMLQNAKNWLELTKNERYIFSVNKKAPKIRLNKNMKSAIKSLADTLDTSLSEDKLKVKINNAIKENEVQARDFYQTIYKILISKTSGPRLAPFILAMGQRKVRKLLRTNLA